MSMAAAPARTAPPAWAVQRVSTVLERQGERVGNDPKVIAQKAGLSKSLAKSCMFFISKGG